MASSYFAELGFEPTGPEGPSSEIVDSQMKKLRALAIMNGIDMSIDVPKASIEAIKKLQNHEITKDEEKAEELECAVCKKPCEEGEIYKILPCKHEFHEDCVLLWLKKANSCPLCRYELETDDPDYEEIRKYRADEPHRKERLSELHDSMFT